MGATEETKSELALFGGVRAVTSDPGDTFAWPIVTEEHERAVLEVLRSGRMSGLDVTRQFEKRYAEMLGRKYALAGPNGTAAILDAMYGLAIGPGDEVICPSITYWASIVQAYVLGAAPVFADVDPDTLCIEPQDFERRITPRTKAVVVVHYAGMPAEMDAIMAIASEHKIKVLEDCSHAHGALYRGNYARHDEITLAELKPFAGLPAGGFKHRMHQLSAAFGLVQLELFPAQIAEIDKAMNAFCDLLEGVPGLHAEHQGRVVLPALQVHPGGIGRAVAVAF